MSWLWTLAMAWVGLLLFLLLCLLLLSWIQRVRQGITEERDTLSGSGMEIYRQGIYFIALSSDSFWRFDVFRDTESGPVWVSRHSCPDTAEPQVRRLARMHQETQPKEAKP